MKKANCYQGKGLKASQNIDEMLERGRMLHSEAVFMGIMKAISLFRPVAGKTVQLPERQRNMRFSQ